MDQPEEFLEGLSRSPRRCRNLVSTRYLPGILGTHDVMSLALVLLYFFMCGILGRTRGWTRGRNYNNHWSLRHARRQKGRASWSMNLMGLDLLGYSYSYR